MEDRKHLNFSSCSAEKRWTQEKVKLFVPFQSKHYFTMKPQQMTGESDFARIINMDRRKISLNKI